MSYRGLGQAKIVPGQINFMTLPPGMTRLPDPEPLLRAGLPLAPYVEHGSWQTGEPDIMRYGRDPYRGIMGVDGLGQILTDLACSGSALNASWTQRTRDALNAAAQAAVAGGIAAGVVGGIAKKPLIAAGIGAVVAYSAFKVWTAPYVV